MNVKGNKLVIGLSFLLLGCGVFIVRSLFREPVEPPLIVTVSLCCDDDPYQCVQWCQEVGWSKKVPFPGQAIDNEPFKVEDN